MPKKAKPVTEITIRSLNSTYGSHASSILSDCLQRIYGERGRGKIKKFKIIKPLPSVEAFREMRTKKYTQSLYATITEAWGEIDSIKEELQQWYDNLPESFQNGTKGDGIQDAINTIESCSEPNVPEENEASTALGKLPITHIPSENVKSRSDRRDEVVSQLQSCIDTIDKLLEKNKKDLTDDEKTMITPAKELRDELDTLVNELGYVEFPGMYG